MSPISDELAVLRSGPRLDHFVTMVAHTDVPQWRPRLQSSPGTRRGCHPATPKPWLRDPWDRKLGPSDRSARC